MGPEQHGRMSGHVSRTYPDVLEHEEAIRMARPSRYAPDTAPRARHWTDDAACAGQDPSVFFPVSRKGVPAAVEARYAKSFCAGCPVREVCLAHALTTREDYGVWGGLDEDERAELRHQARLAAERERRRQQRAEKEQADARAAA